MYMYLLFGSTYIKIGTIQRRLAWPLRKDDTQIREAFHIFAVAVCSLENLNNWNNWNECIMLISPVYWTKQRGLYWWYANSWSVPNPPSTPPPPPSFIKCIGKKKQKKPSRNLSQMHVLTTTHANTYKNQYIRSDVTFCTTLSPRRPTLAVWLSDREVSLPRCLTNQNELSRL